MAIETTGQPQGGEQPAGQTDPAGIQHQPDPAGQSGQPAAPGTLGHGGGVIPERVISVRLKQASEKAKAEALLAHRRELAELGIEDVSKFKQEREAQKKKLQDLEAAEERRQRESMTEQERLKKDLEIANAKIAELTTELTSLQTTSLRREQDEILSAIALKYVSPKYVSMAVRHAFKEYVNTLTAEELEKLDGNRQEIDRWFRRWARDNPELAASQGETQQAAADAAAKLKDDAAKAAAAKPKIIVRRPITNGAGPKGAPPPASVTGGTPSLAGKTPLPGRPNSMTKAEVKQYAATQNIKMPS
jgi:hypothetical protein